METANVLSLMCWAGADRMAMVAAQHAPSMESEFRAAAAKIKDEVVKRAWNTNLQSFTGTYDGQDLDASLLQMASLRLLPPHDERLNATIDAIRRHLSEDGWLVRYRLNDGFGTPAVAFLICTFWLVEALAWTGRMDEANQAMAHIHSAMSPLGLLSEDLRPADRRLWGNFPQAYSHVGLIHAAFAASPRWADLL